MEPFLTVVLVGGALAIGIFLIGVAAAMAGLSWGDPAEVMDRAAVVCGGGAFLAAAVIALAEGGGARLDRLALQAVALAPCLGFGFFALVMRERHLEAWLDRAECFENPLVAAWIALMASGVVTAPALSGVMMNALA